MSHIDEQQSVFETFCSERYGENGCQTSKTITREKGQKIIRLLQNDPVADAYGPKFKSHLCQCSKLPYKFNRSAKCVCRLYTLLLIQTSSWDSWVLG